MSRPAFIVDGFTELKIVQSICPGQPIQRLDLNGKSVTLQAMATKISSFIRLLGNRYYPIVVLVDKEERNIGFQEMGHQLLQLIRDNGIKDQDIRIGVADRMIENWIIADWGTFCNNNHEKPDRSDGINGCAVVRKIKGSYDKRAEGVEYFSANNPSVMYNSSESFRHFVDKLDGIPCGYLAFKR